MDRLAADVQQKQGEQDAKHRVWLPELQQLLAHINTNFSKVGSPCRVGLDDSSPELRAGLCHSQL